MIRVIVADDQNLVRAGLVGLLENSDDLSVVAEAATGVAALDAVRRLRPDVVLMDIRMPEMDGLEATRRIASDPDLAAVKVIVLTTFELDEYVFGAVRAGASGFLAKDIDPQELRRAVRMVGAGEALLSPGATRRLMAHFVTQRRPTELDADRLKSLTTRERDVMAEVARGRSNVEISQRLHMSPATARTHVHRAMAKLGARDRAQLVVIAYESGLVNPGDDTAGV